MRKPSLTGDPWQGYRRLTRSSEKRRDLTPVRWDWQQRLGNWLWASHPVCKKALQNTKNFVCGDGFWPQSLCQTKLREKIQSLLEMHWKINAWGPELARRVETLSVEGEWVYWCTPPHHSSGHIELCKILPENVEEVLRCPLNAERLDEVHLKFPLEFVSWGGKDLIQKFKLAHWDWKSERVRGDGLMLGANRLSGQTRGWSDLLAIADYIDLFDTAIFTEAERIGIQRAFVWDVLIKGKGDIENKVTQRREELQALGPPRPGAVNVHSEDEEWSAKSVQLYLGETIEYLKFILMVCLGGTHNPEHWFAQGGNTNKATASEMGGPAFAHIRERKREIMTFMTLELEMQMQAWVDCGQLPRGLDPKDLAFQILSKDPEHNAYNTIGANLQSVGQGLVIASSQGWLTPQECAMAYRGAAADMGLGDFPGVPPDKTLEAAQQRVSQALDAKKSELSTQKPFDMVGGNDGKTFSRDGSGQPGSPGGGANQQPTGNDP